MKFTNSEVILFNVMASKDSEVVVKGINYAGQRFAVSGVLYAGDGQNDGSKKFLTNSKITLDQNVKDSDNRRNIYLPVYTEPESDGQIGLYILEIEGKNGNPIWTNIQLNNVQDAIENRLNSEEGFNKRKFSNDAKRLLAFVGKPCIIYGKKAIVLGVREFDTPRGFERYLDVQTADGVCTVCVTPDAVKLDKKANKSGIVVAPVEENE